MHHHLQANAERVWYSRRGSFSTLSTLIGYLAANGGRRFWVRIWLTTKVIRGHPQQFLKNYIITALPDIKPTLSIFPITDSTLAILVK